MPPMTELWFESALLPQGWARDVRLTIADGMIAAVTPDTPPGPLERQGIALPGLANLHSHAFQRGMAGLAECSGPSGAENFWSWREAMYRFVERLNPDDCEAIAAFAYMEMLEAGFTRVGEFHYLHHDPAGRPYANQAEMAQRIAAAAAATGIGLTLLPVFYAHAGFGGLPPTPGQRRFINGIGQFAALLEASRAAVANLPGAVLGIAPHSLRAVTPSELAKLIPLAPNGPIHIHAAEQTGEVEACLAWCGLRPVAYLLENFGLDAKWCLIHATHMDTTETAALAASGAVAGLCPITEANLGDGIFPAYQYKKAGGAIGIGTDSNVLIDAAQELRQLEYAARLTSRARNVLAPGPNRATGAHLFTATVAGGAQALGAPGAGLAVGAPADFFTLRRDHPAFAGRAGDALLDSWIFAVRTGAIDGVWRWGIKYVTGGLHHGREKIEKKYRATISRILE